MCAVCMSVCIYVQGGWTLLFAAACSGNVQLFELLLQKYDFAPDKWDKVSAVHILRECAYTSVLPLSSCCTQLHGVVCCILYNLCVYYLFTYICLCVCIRISVSASARGKFHIGVFCLSAVD